ncbi:DsbA family protein [Celeribacter marinus]|uniref:DsbA family protein n=1 Tax=Celeribacter marinus TaxID=1397108 RepID=UPI003172F632
MALPRFLTRLTTAALLTASTAFGAHALDLSDMSSAERAAFGAEVRAYLMENPEVLMDAVDVYNQRQQAAQEAGEAGLIAAHAADLFEAEGDLVYGNPDADLVFVEFSDYRCGYCKKAYPDVKALLEKDGNIKLIVKEYPILGEESVLAARFALAVRSVGGVEAYDAIHDALMTTRGNVTEGSLKRMAKDLGLDGDAVMAATDSDAVNEILGRNQQLGQIFQISGTPTFVMGEQLIRGYVPFDAMNEIVAELRQNR